MFPPCYFETDCYALNRRARLYYPWPRRLVDFFRNSFPYYQNKPGLLLTQNKKQASLILSKIETLQQEVCWEQNLQTASYAVFDCETTGLQPLKGDKIISLGGVIIEKGRIRDGRIFDQLVDPLLPIPPAAAALTGITDSLVAGKPNINQALPDFLDFLGNRILVAHHATFDLTFLNLALGHFAPIRIPQPVIDTYLLSRYILPGLGGHTLDHLGTSHNISLNQRHTALGDALITAQIFLRLLNGLAEMGIYTLSQLRNYLELKKNAEPPLTIAASSF